LSFRGDAKHRTRNLEIPGSSLRDARNDKERKSQMSTTTHAPKRIGRQGAGWEVAYAALFPISNESSYVNAHTLFLDAGRLAGIVRS
jgi:NAD(P)-dependent dehydrogenase (short-subunit alcohol dehydrogenase family)